MANGQDYARLLRMMLGQGGPNPYMGLDLKGQVGDWLQRKQAQYFPSQYNNMLYYIPDEYDAGANSLANFIYNNR